MHLFLPLLSSILYVLSALFLKQAAERGIGVWRTAFVCNGITALLFLLLLPLGGSIPSGIRLFEPVVVALLFVAGQLFTFLALDRGDVSVATPVLGAKVILVAIFSTVLTGAHLPLTLWCAAAASCLGIAFLNRKPAPIAGPKPPSQVAATIGFALQAAAAYALFDVLVMHWAPAWGPGRFLPITMLCSALFSAAFLPLFRAPLTSFEPGAARPLFLGALFIALQALVLVTTLAVFGDAVAVNVIYSTRGLWSVLAVWSIGSWFGNREHELGGSTLRLRLFGASLLSIAVLLVFL